MNKLIKASLLISIFLTSITHASTTNTFFFKFFKNVLYAGIGITGIYFAAKLISESNIGGDDQNQSENNTGTKNGTSNKNTSDIKYPNVENIYNNDANNDGNENNQGENNTGKKILQAIKSGATKTKNFMEDAAKGIKNSINKNFNTNCDVKIEEAKKETKNLAQKFYDWAGNTFGLKK